MKNGIHVWKARPGVGKGQWRAKLVLAGKSIAVTGESLTKKSQALNWGKRIKRALAISDKVYFHDNLGNIL